MDPLSVTSSILAVGGFALKSSVELHKLVRSFQSQDKDARALKAEVSDLTLVLQSLLETVASNPTLDFGPLEIPLQRCGHACEDYGRVIGRCTKHSGNGSRSSFRDWVTQKYLQGDINDFRAMLASHKATINIAIANANLRITAITPEVLDDYKEMISDTATDLTGHLQAVQEKIDQLEGGRGPAAEDVVVELKAIMEEKASTEHGLDMCAQLSVQIQQFEAEPPENEQFSHLTSAHKYVKSGLGDVKESIESLVTRLREHEAAIRRQLEAASSGDRTSEPVRLQLERLRQIKESISQCIQIVSEARESADERCNVFEDITLADNSYAFSVSTVNDLVKARRLNLKGRSRHFGGQVTDETVQKSIAALTGLDMEYFRGGAQSPKREDTSEEGERFHRFGPGNRLLVKKTS